MAWRSLSNPVRQPPIERPPTVTASELAAYGFCPQAHRMEMQERMLFNDGTANPAGAYSAEPDFADRAWDTPAATRGRVAHSRHAQRTTRATGAWGARTSMAYLMLALALSAIVKFG